MKENKGITMVVLVITIVVLLILVGISIGTGNKVIKSSELENIKTNMLLIKVKGKEYVENANFNIGTAFDNITDETEKTNRINKAKAELKGTEITNINEFNGDVGITETQFQKDTTELVFYYNLTTQHLIDMGLSNVESDEKNGWYIIRYDIKNVEVEVYNTAGFENEEDKYYSLNELQNLEIDF